MKVKIIVSKKANLFFFVANLSNWHFSCVPEYNEIWLKKIEQLSSEDKIYLKKFRLCLKKYDFKKRGARSLYIGVPFFVFGSNDKLAQERLKQQITIAEMKTIKAVLDRFSGRFNLIWKEARPRLLKIESYLNRELKNTKLIKVFNALEKLFKTDFSTKTHNLIILAAPKESPLAGGSYFEPGLIALEISSPEKRKDFLAVFLHELTHEYLEIKFYKIIKRFAKENQHKLREIKNLVKIFKRSPKELLEELVVLAFLPDGYLGEKYLGSGERILKSEKEAIAAVKTGDWNALEKFVIARMRKLNKTHVENNKPLDAEYLKAVAETIKRIK